MISRVLRLVFMKIPDIDFTPAAPDGTLIEILDLDDLYLRRDKMNHNPEQPHRMGFSMIIFIRQGIGSHFIDFNCRPFHDDSVIFVTKNQINAFDLSNRPQGRAVLFSDELIGKLQASMKMPLLSPDYLKHDYEPVMTLTQSLRKSCYRLLKEIDSETRNREPNSLVTMYLFSALLIMLERERSTAGEESLTLDEKIRFADFISLLEVRFVETRNATDYADALHVTYKTLNSLCKKATEQTAKQLIDAYTILEAKRRLVVEKKRVQELAFELGFDEVTNFTKYFKKHARLSPSHFQNIS